MGWVDRRARVDRDIRCGLVALDIDAHGTVCLHGSPPPSNFKNPRQKPATANLVEGQRGLGRVAAAMKFAPGRSALFKR